MGSSERLPELQEPGLPYALVSRSELNYLWLLLFMSGAPQFSRFSIDNKESVMGWSTSAKAL